MKLGTLMELETIELLGRWKPRHFGKLGIETF